MIMRTRSTPAPVVRSSPAPLSEYRAPSRKAAPEVAGEQVGDDERHEAQVVEDAGRVEVETLEQEWPVDVMRVQGREVRRVEEERRHGHGEGERGDGEAPPRNPKRGKADEH